MKKVLLLIYPTFSEFEITVATAILKEKYQIVTAWKEKRLVAGESGLQILPHVTLDEVCVDDFEAILIPGGDLIHVKDEGNLFKLIRTFHYKRKLIAAVCSGGYMLARAGLLENTPYTVTLTREQRHFLGCFNENGYRYDQIVEHENLITAQGHAFAKFGLRVGERLGAVKPEHYAFYRGIDNPKMVVPSPLDDQQH